MMRKPSYKKITSLVIKELGGGREGETLIYHFP